MDYRNKIVIITGGEHGIGRSISIAFAQKGARVIIAGLKTEYGNELADSINKEGGRARFVCTDVRSKDSIQSLFASIELNEAGVDVLINNAGKGIWVSPYDLDVDAWDDVLNTNLRGTFLMSREAARWMKRRGGGAIVNIASTRAFMSEPNSEAYAASKGGIVALTHALAASLAPDHIQVNCISPGWIETGDYDALKPSDHLQHFAGRVGRPEDIARACLFLSDPANNFISGTNLTIDGGMTRKMIYEE